MRRYRAPSVFGNLVNTLCPANFIKPPKWESCIRRRARDHDALAIGGCDAFATTRVSRSVVAEVFPRRAFPLPLTILSSRENRRRRDLETGGNCVWEAGSAREMARRARLTASSSNKSIIVGRLFSIIEDERGVIDSALIEPESPQVRFPTEPKINIRSFSSRKAMAKTTEEKRVVCLCREHFSIKKYSRSGIGVKLCGSHVCNAYNPRTRHIVHEEKFTTLENTRTCRMENCKSTIIRTVGK